MYIIKQCDFIYLISVYIIKQCDFIYFISVYILKYCDYILITIRSTFPGVFFQIGKLWLCHYMVVRDIEAVIFVKVVNQWVNIRGVCIIGW